MANELQTVAALIDEAVSGMSDEMLLFHPGEKWSSSQILEHLALAFSGTAKGMSKVLEAGKPLARRRTLRDLVSQVTVLTFQYFPPGRQAPKMVVPTGTLGGLEAVQKIRSDLEVMAAKMNEAEKRIGTGKRSILDHPILGPMNLRQWKRFHLVHTRHHMGQVKGLRAMQIAAKAVSA